MSRDMHRAFVIVCIFLYFAQRTIQEARITFTNTLETSKIIEVCNSGRYASCCVPLDLEIGITHIWFYASEVTFSEVGLDQKWLEVYTYANGRGCQGQPAIKAEHGFSEKDEIFVNQKDLEGFSGALFRSGLSDGKGTVESHDNRTVDSLVLGVQYPTWIVYENTQYYRIEPESLVYRDDYGQGKREIRGKPFINGQCAFPSAELLKMLKQNYQKCCSPILLLIGMMNG